jgi:uncharacterized protein
MLPGMRQHAVDTVAGMMNNRIAWQACVERNVKMAVLTNQIVPKNSGAAFEVKKG